MSQNNDPSNDNKDYPGYPHYPPSEDITRNAENVTAKEEGVVTGDEEDVIIPPDDPDEADQAADVTEEDIRALSAADQGRDIDDPDAEEPLLDETDDDGDPLNEPGNEYGRDGDGLDVPGSEADDRDEAAGEEDEENNYYSLGGDNHENLEEDQS